MITPHELGVSLPLTHRAEKTVLRARAEISAILEKKSRKLIVIVGPCSIHDPKAAIEYAEKLQVEIEKYNQTLCIIMRTYLEKSRTSIGWKGLINDPDLNQSCDIDKGLKTARALLLTINASNVPCATEMLNPLSAHYYADLIAWAVIGARTAESQPHRELASNLPMPIGFKNSTDGNIQAAINSMQAAKLPQTFLGLNHAGKVTQINSSGNAHAHIVLRGSIHSTNYNNNILNSITTPFIVDCSHGNSQKDPQKQMLVLDSLCETIENNQTNIAGLMLESNLLPGKQNINPPLIYGKSITDACIGWEETKMALAKIDNAVRNMIDCKQATLTE